MPLIATPSRRRMAMAVMLALAVGGGVIRRYAPNPSTLHDLGTLLLVMWLPAVGNFVGYLMGKLPRSAPPPVDFAPGAAFMPQLQADIEPVALPPDFLDALDPTERRATLLVGRHGYTVRLALPMAQWLAGGGSPQEALELLRPQAALGKLPPGTAFHLLVGTTAVGRGRIVRNDTAPA